MKETTGTAIDFVTEKGKKAHKSNSRKHLVPCFIQDILEEETDPENHVTQAYIGKVLAERYEVKISRGALGRQIHAILEEPEVFCIFGSATEGYWSDREYFRSGRFIE